MPPGRISLSPGQPLTDYQIDNLIFEPGFSNADKITDVSGRGVGMDVVKKALYAMRGMIEVFSTEGKGCHLVFRIPLTLAIMDEIIARIGEERHIIRDDVRKRR